MFLFLEKKEAYRVPTKKLETTWVKALVRGLVFSKIHPGYFFVAKTGVLDLFSFFFVFVYTDCDSCSLPSFLSLTAPRLCSSRMASDENSGGRPNVTKCSLT